MSNELKLVPIEPTKEMRAAFDAAWSEAYSGHLSCSLHCYRAAIAAAPHALQVKRVPLTDEQIEDMLGDANRGFNIEKDDYFKAVRDAEAAHGINEQPRCVNLLCAPRRCICARTVTVDSTRRLLVVITQFPQLNPLSPK